VAHVARLADASPFADEAPLPEDVIADILAELVRALEGFYIRGGP
jgi:hypothetical protein